MMFYTIFGTSRHFSAGTEAIASILTATAINKYQGILYPASTPAANATLDGTGFLSLNIAEARAIIAMAITLMVGIIQVRI